MPACSSTHLPLLLLLLPQEGEAPEEVRAVLQQRSRWAKGHFQVFFSRHCPLVHPKLNMLQRVLYTNGTAACIDSCQCDATSATLLSKLQHVD
jgi:cellulose synthase/poly-beta-1,6-N-acetylglucosamine synthase-like glycosyltransferase